MNNALNIFEFSEYRTYLKAWIEAARQAKTSNLTRLAEVAQIHPTFLSHVLVGTKELSLEQAALISDHLKHTKLERDYFFILIHLDRAGNKSLRDYWLEKMALLKLEKNKLSQRFEKHRQLTQEQRVIFYSSWIYVAVWGSTAINNGQTLNDVAERFRISRARAEEILSFLVKCGVCNQTADRYTVGEMHVHIPNESPLVVKHHTNWRIKSMQKMDVRESTELFFTSPMSMAKKDFELIREKLNILIKDVVGIATESTAEELVCLNIDLFRTIA